MTQEMFRRKPLPSTSAVRVKESIVEEGLTEALKQLAKNHAALVAAQQEDVALKAKIYELMQIANVQTFAHGAVTASVTRPKGRDTNVIDPRGYHRLVTDDEFYDTVTVGITKAKTVLTQTELAKVTTIKPGKLGEPELVIAYAV